MWNLANVNVMTFHFCQTDLSNSKFLSQRRLIFVVEMVSWSPFIAFAMKRGKMAAFESKADRNKKNHCFHYWILDDSFSSIRYSTSKKTSPSCDRYQNLLTQSSYCERIFLVYIFWLVYCSCLTVMEILLHLWHHLRFSWFRSFWWIVRNFEKC